VPSQLGVVQKPLAAALHFAHELPLPVSHHVLAQGASVCEYLPTTCDVAGVGLFPFF
jgi:hypothetical protein